MIKFIKQGTVIIVGSLALSAFTSTSAQAGPGDRYELRINCSACPGGYSSGGIYASSKLCYAAKKKRRENGDKRDMGCMKYYG